MRISDWSSDVCSSDLTLDVGRIVRALRVSSRPPKAGAPLPPEIRERLTTMAGEALTADAAAERWVAVLDALAFSPVRDKVIPTSLPVELHADVRSVIARLATRIPKVAHIFEIAPDPTAPRPKPERRRPNKPKKPQGDRLAKDQAANERKPKSEAAEDAPHQDAPSEPTAAEEATPATEAAPAEAAATDDAAPAEAPAPEAEATPAEAPAEAELASSQAPAAQAGKPAADEDPPIHSAQAYRDIRPTQVPLRGSLYHRAPRDRVEETPGGKRVSQQI